MESTLEYILTNSYKAEIISFMDIHPEVFDDAVKLAVSDKQPYAWRAAWLLCNYMEENDHRIRPNIKTIVNVLRNKKDGHQSGLLKILLRMELDEEYESVLFDICISTWQDINKIPSVRLYALKMILKIAKKYPELSNEISSLAQDCYIEQLSSGVKHSIRKMLKGVIRNSEEIF
jgi:hypothetical protein